MAPQGWIAKTDPDGKEWELIAAGMRNPFDIAFNHDGELFTYDADMEWDIGEPWYRPTRVNHIISGAEFGFRNGSGKWPAYYIDSFGAVVDIGPGSPTGTLSATARSSRRSIRMLCSSATGASESSARPHQACRVQLHRRGRRVPQRPATASHRRGDQPERRGNVPRRRRPRGAQSALYRVTYTGNPAESKAETIDPQIQAQCDLRHKLESFHGHRDAAAVSAAGPISPIRIVESATPLELHWNGRIQPPGVRRL